MIVNEDEQEQDQVISIKSFSSLEYVSCMG